MNTEELDDLEIFAEEKKTKAKQIISDGTHYAYCYKIIDLGTSETKDDYSETGFSEVRKIKMSFETPFEKAVFSKEKGEQPFSVDLDLYFKKPVVLGSKYVNMLSCWRGKEYNLDTDKFNLLGIFDFIGKDCMITVETKETEYLGKKFKKPKITNIQPKSKGLADSKQTNENKILILSPKYFDRNIFSSLPEFMREEIEKSKEFHKLLLL
jgi:hypothetical protein